MTNMGNLNATFAKSLSIFYNDNATNRTSDASNSLWTDAWRDVHHNFGSLHLLFSSGHRSPTLLGLLPPRPDLAPLAHSTLPHCHVPHLHRSLLTPCSAPLPRSSRAHPHLGPRFGRVPRCPLPLAEHAPLAKLSQGRC
jgi:hypothetical protein